MVVGADSLEGAEEQSTWRFRVRVKAMTDRRELVIQVDRPDGDPRTPGRRSIPWRQVGQLVLSDEEADALLIALMNEIG